MSTYGHTALGRTTGPFESWDDVLRFVDTHGYVYYQGALSHYAAFVKAKVMAEPGKILVTPADKGADPFVADNTYLALFKRPA